MSKIYSFKSTKRSECKTWMSKRLIVGDVVPIQHKSSPTVYAVVARSTCLTKGMYPILLEKYNQIRSLINVRQETGAGYFMLTKYFIEFMFPPVDARNARSIEEQLSAHPEGATTSDIVAASTYGTKIQSIMDTWEDEY